MVSLGQDDTIFDTMTGVAMVVLDPGSSVPPFQQVREQIAAAIERGTLQPAVRLPTVRSLADDLGLAVNTVARSYRELERAGVVETRGRHGTFVSSGSSARQKTAAREARTFARRMRALGIGDEETFAILRREIDCLGRGPSPRSSTAR
jgi:DNA-binding transcriptional regulator YhcF (GntR family)